MDPSTVSAGTDGGAARAGQQAIPRRRINRLFWRSLDDNIQGEQSRIGHILARAPPRCVQSDLDPCGNLTSRAPQSRYRSPRLAPFTRWIAGGFPHNRSSSYEWFLRHRPQSYHTRPRRIRATRHNKVITGNRNLRSHNQAHQSSSGQRSVMDVLCCGRLK